MTRDDIEQIKRHFGVIADGLRSEIRLVAEGHSALDLKLERVHEEVSGFRQEFSQFRQEVQIEFRGNAVACEVVLC